MSKENKIMKVTLASVQYDTFDIDFQKVFDFMKNEGGLENTVYDYCTEFGNNIYYYLEQVYGITISYGDIYDYDELCEKMYPSVLNENLLDDLYSEYCDWLDKNKEKLDLTED